MCHLSRSSAQHSLLCWRRNQHHFVLRVARSPLWLWTLHLAAVICTRAAPRRLSPGFLLLGAPSHDQLAARGRRLMDPLLGSKREGADDERSLFQRRGAHLTPLEMESR